MDVEWNPVVSRAGIVRPQPSGAPPGFGEATEIYALSGHNRWRVKSWTAKRRILLFGLPSDFFEREPQPKPLIMKSKKSLLEIFLVGLLTVNAQAATTLVSSTFEGSLGDWTASTGASLYTYSTGTNYASTGNGAANLPKGNGTITLTDALPLDAQGYTSITIGFNYVWLNGTTTRFLNIEYAADGINFTQLARVTSGNGGSPGSPGTLSVTLLEGTDHTISGSGTILNASFLPSFTDTAKFRFVDSASAAADVRVFVDNITITGTPEYVPEPRAALLGSLGLIALLRRRR